MIFDYIYAISFVLFGLGVYGIVLATLQMILKDRMNKRLLESSINLLFLFGIVVAIKIIWMWNV